MFIRTRCRYLRAKWIGDWNGFCLRMRLAGLRRAQAGSRGSGARSGRVVDEGWKGGDEMIFFFFTMMSY